MLLQNSPSLENIIIKLLAQTTSGVSAEEIGKKVARVYRAYSRRGIFKELQRLIAEGIIVRTKSLYVLRLAWVFSLQNEVELLLKNCTEAPYIREALPSKDKNITISCHDLVGWDRAWTQLMLMLHMNFPTLPMFIWSPHHWFTITHPEIENTYTRANEVKKNLRFVIIGGRSALDVEDRPIIARKSTAFSFRMSPFEYDRTHYYWGIGDYYGVSTLDKRIAKKIDTLYEEHTSHQEISAATKKFLLSQKIRGSIRCEWAPERAEKLRKKFTSLFKITLNSAGEIVQYRKGEF